ncbi:MAG: hypothetical protein ABI151_01405, partial [Chitinophagaceae bacterium]
CQALACLQSKDLQTLQPAFRESLTRQSKKNQLRLFQLPGALLANSHFTCCGDCGANENLTLPPNSDSCDQHPYL